VKSYTADEVRAAEAPLLAAGVPLMRMAAAALAGEVRALAPQRILVLAGSGDNGGDALYAAAELAAVGIAVDVWRVGSRVHEAALAAATDAGAQLVDGPTDADLVLDGILGIGAQPPLRGTARDAVLQLLELDPRPRVVAVDLPSGVHPDDGSADEAVLPADLTVTFGAMKRGLLLEPGRTLAGRVVVVDLGLGLSRVELHGELVCTDEEQAAIVREQLPRHLELTRAEPGCTSFTVTPTSDPLVWRVEESFRDAAAFRAHQDRAAASDWGRTTQGIERRYTVTGL
jgi:hydroxyethylthiazole kinase-like uncharacterized protein yjeF